jgi:glucose-1-phosphate thymidylyltransferase
MKAIVPTAGQGTRLYPHTHTKPKPIVRLAGQPILGHILDRFRSTDIDEVVVVIGGPMKNQVVEYAQSAFGDRFEFRFVEQPAAEGLGHSIYQAEPVVGAEPVIIALGDMIFESGYHDFLGRESPLGRPDGRIGVKRVEDPRHYGVVDVDGDGRIRSLVEKPDDPPSNLAISGVYVIHDSRALFDALAHLIDNGMRGAGNEYQLTDGLQLMIDDGATLDTFEVTDWYDCGRPETLLEANRVCLGQLAADHDGVGEQSVLIEPVDVGENVTIEQSVVGPDVSLDDGVTIRKSIVENSIVGRDSRLESVNLDGSIIGDNTEVGGNSQELNVGDNSIVNNL